MNKTHNGIGWANLLVGILFIMASTVAFRNPTSDLAAIILIFGIAAISKGVATIFVRGQLKQNTGVQSSTMMVVGILDIIIGLILLFNITSSMIALPFVFAIWFIVDSIEGLMLLDRAREISKGYYWFTLIISILGILIGIQLFFDPISSALTIAFLIGFELMLAGILYIVRAFSHLS